MICNLRSTVDYASGLFCVQATEPDATSVFWLGCYRFPDNRFYTKSRPITRDFPLTNALRVVDSYTTRQPNLQYGYTISVVISGALAPISYLGLGSEPQKTTWVAFEFIYRAFLKRGRFLWLETKRRVAFTRLFLPSWWFGERSYGGDL